MLKDFDKIIIQVPRDAVETEDLDFMLNTLSHLLENQESVKRLRNSLTICFDGYNTDPRDVFEILEIRQYMRAVTQKFPYWFYFCSIEDHTLWLVLLCHCRMSKPTPGNYQFNHDDAYEIMSFLFHHLNQLFIDFKLDETEINGISKKIGEYYSSRRIPSYGPKENPGGEFNMN